ncbi:aldo/keto reductase [bacterium]|nr:aldo/keto reductase [bacterium]
MIQQLAQKYQRTPAQIILRWQLQAGYIVIPGSSNPEHIAENFAVFVFALLPEEMEQIAAINQGRRYEN